MESAILTEVAVASFVVAASALIGYRAQGSMGSAMLALGALLASTMTIAGMWLGFRLFDSSGAWIGLVLASGLVAFLAWKAGNAVVRGEAGRFAAGLWLGFVALCIFGYLAGGPLGLLTLTLPAMLIFWIGLYRISAYLLPLEDKRHQRTRSFRSLMTFTMGTNYPYYVAHDGRCEERVAGNAYNQFFAGPGIVLADCDQAVYITDGIKVKGLGRPGLTFTEMFDLAPRVIDLRAQLRAFDVEAVTRDGIPIRVLTFVPFRIRRPRADVKLKASFPFDHRAVFQIVASERIRREGARGNKTRLDWRADLVPMEVTRIVQDIIGSYRVDDLCAARDPDADPRIQIRDEMRARAKEAMAPYGIEVLGGGISNLDPQHQGVVQRRIENWQTKWEHKVLVELSEGEADRIKQIEEARARAEADVILRLARMVGQRDAEGTVTHTALALRLIDCLAEMVSAGENQWPPPPALTDVLDRLRGKLAPGRS